MNPTELGLLISAIGLILGAVGNLFNIYYQQHRLEYERLKVIEIEKRLKEGRMTDSQLEDRLKGILRRMKNDPVFFSKVMLGFTPYPAIHFAFTHEGITLLIVSRGLRQSMLMFKVISNFIWGSPILRRSVERSTQVEIRLKNGSRIIALPCSADGNNLRGHTADMVIMDEAAFMPESVIGDVIFPMLATTELSRGTGIAIMISTPWGREHIFYRCYSNPNWFRMHISSDMCPLITEEFLKEQRALVGELRFDTEYMAKFREDAMAFLTQDMLRGAIEEQFYDLRVEKGLPPLFTEDELHTLPKMTGEYALGCSARPAG